MLIKRRNFLQAGSLATASLLVPGLLKSMEGGPAQAPPGNKVLIILQLNGGNDGLNTFIPYRNDIYYRARPVLGIPSSRVLPLTDETGIHPALPYLRELYQEGHFSILNNVGYPSPDRSHFRSMDIWHSASGADEFLHTGWLGRYLDEQCKDCDHATQVLELDDMLSLALKGNKQNGLALSDVARLYRTSTHPLYGQLAQEHAHIHEEHTAAYLYKTLAGTMSNAAYIFEKCKQFQVTGDFPGTAIGKDFRTIASLILSDINTRVYYLSVGSFDTHVAQDLRQRRLFLEIDNAVRAFVGEMKKHNRFNDVLIAGFSEFGRRVEQNASVGTDHGAANNMFFIGGQLKKQGLLNELPDLADLDNGDLRFSIDFRQVYATLLERWLDMPSAKILGADFAPLAFL